VVSVKSKVRDRNQSYKTLALPLDLDIPLVVLINKSSASASEIVSGVIQDMDRGVLMGQRSYGKGLVQNTKDVGYNSRVKVTTSKYYIPSGRCIQSVEYKDGEPVDIADDKRSKFKTKGGRTVLDGGGVTPDVKLEPAKVPEVLQALKDQHLIFKYVDNYVPSIDTSGMQVEEIVFTDFAAFKSYLQKEKFDFESKNEKLLSEVMDNLKEEDSASITPDITSVSNKIKTSKAAAIDAYKEDIVNAIELEIATQLFLQEGKVYQKLIDDSEIDQAVDLLLDQARYNTILK
jgi:carboxyl-terminal processing protease